MEDLSGLQLGPYRVVAPQGEGGMAAVYKAYQAGMDRYVALKVLPRYFASDPQFVGRFEQEAKVLARLLHPHILPVHDYGETDGYTYIVMPFVESGTLADVLRGKPLPLAQIRSIISQVGDALDYAHSEGVVHRDVKPSNVLIDQRGNCLLTDFGIAKMVEGTAHFTRTGGIVGTPAYMSPEQIQGESLDGRSDIYSLGIVLYEMATGRPPYRAETPPAIFVKHLHDPLPPPRTLNPAMPEAIERVILKALAKQRQERYATADDMVQALLTETPDAALAEAGPNDEITVVVPDGATVQGPDGETEPTAPIAELPRAGIASEPADVLPPGIERMLQSPVRANRLAVVDDLVQLARGSDEDLARLAIEKLKRLITEEQDLMVQGAAQAGLNEIGIEIPGIRFPSGEVVGSLTDWVSLADQHWQEAAQFLYDGQLEKWLDYQGEVQLAGEAERIRQQAVDDQNLGLEQFQRLAGGFKPHRKRDAATNLDRLIAQLNYWKVRQLTARQTLTLEITNQGRGFMHGRVQNKVPWVETPEPWFGCLPGETSTVEVRVDPTKLKTWHFSLLPLDLSLE